MDVPVNQSDTHVLYESALKWRKKQLVQQQQTWTIDEQRQRVAVIVEPRQHAMLEAVVRNTMSFLGPTFNLHIFTAHPEWVASLFPGCQQRITRLTEVDEVQGMSTRQYSELLRRVEFWNLISEEHVVIFQTDVIMFREMADTWLQYDFAGGTFYLAFGPEGKHYLDFTQGGFSLRRKSAMIECLTNVSDDVLMSAFDWLRPTCMLFFKGHFPEDLYFSLACEVLKKKQPGLDERHLLSIEGDYYYKPVAFHGFDKLYTNTHKPYHNFSLALWILINSVTFAPFVKMLPVQPPVADTMDLQSPTLLTCHGKMTKTVYSTNYGSPTALS